MAQIQKRYTQRMLDAASCRQRFFIEHVKNFRLSNSERWFPPRLKDLLAELLFARDWAIANDKGEEHIETMMNRMERRWWSEIEAKHNINPRLREEMMAISAEAFRIANHYSECNRIDLIGKPLRKKQKPVIREIVEHRLPSFEKKKRGGVSRYSFASLIERVIDDGGYRKLFIRHFTSSTDPKEVRLELERRMDVWGTVWNAEKFFRKKIDSIVFDVIRTKSPSDPALLKCKQCKGSGKVKKRDVDQKVLVSCDKCGGDGIEAVSTKKCDTTVEIWTRCYHKYRGKSSTPHYKNAAEELIGALCDRGNTFVYRVEVQVDGAKIEQWLSDTYESIREIEQLSKRNTYPRNHSQCKTGFNGCPYRSYCSGAASEQSGEIFFKVSPEEYPGLHTWNR